MRLLNFGAEPVVMTRDTRQATLHDCLPRLLGNRDKRIETVYGDEKIFFTGPEQPRQDKNLLYRHNEPNELTKEGPLSFVPFGSPIASVSTVSRGHQSLVSLIMRYTVSAGSAILPPRDTNQCPTHQMLEQSIILMCASVS